MNFVVLDDLVSDAESRFSAATDLVTLENEKAYFFGKKGIFTKLFKEIKNLNFDEKRKHGNKINQIKKKIEHLLTKYRKIFNEAELNKLLTEESIDVTLPGRGTSLGSVHPIMQSWKRIEEIFCSFGFDIIDGPEIEDDWTNFTALNNALDHPARSMQDTFYIDINDDQGLPLLLRTHTSPMQVRHAKMNHPPIKIIAPGKTYRIDNDSTHSPMFHQIEGLWISDNISFSHLKGIYTNFLHCFFETDNISVRFRPSFFPFTEPSAEIDMKFTTGPNKNQWMEISGSGQVHPKVMLNFGLDPKRYIGFAFGSGLERLTMLRYGINDLRQFYEGDLRFARQFSK
ncbi:MAG: phenylalanine--tRNA ligase subunit alpha [Bordetella sp.]|nr:MAG: phenylalanine--tRNA ligase subunit alpha [Bordetella sp.]